MRRSSTASRVHAERMRIARELPDVIAHSTAMINVQASAAARLLAEDPVRAASAIQALAQAARAPQRAS